MAKNKSRINYGHMLKIIVCASARIFGVGHKGLVIFEEKFKRRIDTWLISTKAQ
jgi:hypothetical protein